MLMLCFKGCKVCTKNPFKSLPGAKASTGAVLFSRPHNRVVVPLTRVDSWAGRDVLEARVIDGLAEDGVAKAVCARERNSGRVCAAPTSDLDLEACNVWLRVSCTSVEGKNLGTNKVISRSDRLGNGEGLLSAVGIEDLSTPGSGSAGVAVLSHLEEGSRSSSLRIRNLRHVDVDGAVVVATDRRLAALAITRLSVHLNGKGTSSSNRADSGRGSWATATEHVGR